jgi:hypothetical protein
MDSTSLVCPCCSEYIYDLYKCNNSHNLCGNCFMRVRKCPICRETLTDANRELNILSKSIERKNCKNYDRGCNSSLYIFDNDHESLCMYKTFKCKFCNSIFDDNNTHSTITEKIIHHYVDNCVNTFQILKYAFPVNNENDGYEFYIKNLEIAPTLIVIDTHYYVMMIPKKLENKINFMIFSTLSKYQYSDYKIKINDISNKTLLERNIVYKQFENNITPLTPFIQSTQSNQKISFSIKNNFLLDHKVKSYKVNGVHFIETQYVEGEPDSAGHWRKSTYDDLLKSFKDVLSNKS